MMISSKIRALDYILIAFSTVLLLTMLSYPFGYDQEVFAVAGEMAVKHNAVAYRDFIDTKPPGIFMIYGISSAIFGHNEWGIRIVDIIFHIFSLFLLYKIFKYTLKDERVAFYSVILYSFFYVTSGFWVTAQTETFAILPSLLIFLLAELAINGKHSFRNGILSGICVIALFLLKYTLITVPIATVLYIILESESSYYKDVKYYLAGLLLGFSISLGIFILYLVYTGAYDHFIGSIEWLKYYSSVVPLFSAATIQEKYFNAFPIMLVFVFSLSPLFLFVIGLLAVKRSNETKSNPYIHLGIQLAIGIATVIYERKFFPYHYSRVFWAIIPFICLGILKIFEKCKSNMLHYKAKGFIQQFTWAAMLIPFSVALCFFSPIPRLYTHPFKWTYARLFGKDIGNLLQSNVQKYYYKDQVMVGDSLAKILQPKDQLFFWGNSIGIYFETNKFPTTFCLTNTPFVSPKTPDSWKRMIIDALQKAPPKIFISEFGDDRAYITGDSLDSWQHLQQWAELKTFVETNYTERPTIGHFRIFERK